MKNHVHRWKSVMIGIMTVMGVASCSSGSAISESAEPLLVAGAADLQPAFEELGDRFTAETGQAVTFTFGSSGQLSQQL
ncbi:MAG: substrate-binding domain-containing protein, partial [Dietzia sp.]